MSTATETVERSEGRQGLASMIRRVKIRNYKSIKNCDVELGPFTILVGRNGSGKSNFLDAIRLVSEGLREPQIQDSWALLPWGAVADNGFSISESWIMLEIDLDDDTVATYSLCLGVRLPAGFTVLNEQLIIRKDKEIKARYSCSNGEISASSGFMPPASANRFYLSRASVVPEFRPVYDALSSTAFYNLEPEAIRKEEDASPQLLLTRDGANLASIFGSLASARPEVKERVLAYMAVVVPEYSDIEHWANGRYSRLIFHRADPHGEPRTLYSLGISDGTLRSLGILVAINQLASDGRPIRLVGIEEPETALHPAAAGALMGALREAATHTQVLVTTHSADLLDRFDPDEGDHLLLATMSGGATHLTEIDPASKRIIRKHLDTAGGLLRMDQLEPDPADLDRQNAPTPSPGGNGDI